MKKFIAILALAAAASLIQVQSADAGRHTIATVCKHEDSHNCVWDAKHSGNGQGRSFIDRHGKVTFISHRAAHALTH